MVDVSYRGATYNLSLFRRDCRVGGFAEYIKESICYNQGELIQYSFLAAEFHKYMKEEFGRGNCDIAIECQKALLGYLSRNLERITKENLNLMKSYFKNRGKGRPRICVKGGFDIQNTESVVSVFRDSNVNYDSSCGIEENTGFSYVCDTGKPFLCNNLPESAKRKEYKNPRLDADVVDLYVLPSWAKRKLGMASGEDEKWKKCWRSKKGGHVVPDSCYKSTLIVPMTLRNNSLDSKFKESIKLDDVDRVIFGFLCFDHVDLNYFIENEDVYLGYVFADILSVYFVYRMMYTSMSETFKSVDFIRDYS